jgi:kynurenine formamidase
VHQPLSHASPTREVLHSYFMRLSNWGRWGADDDLGTLNLITPACRTRAAGLVRTGLTVPLARVISPTFATGNPDPALHHMLESGAGAGAGFHPMTDWFGLACHGFAVTHVDALTHVAWDGRLYNGRSADGVSTRRGGRHGAAGVAAGRMVGRGVFVDGPALRGVPWLELEYRLYPGDFEEWEDRTGTRIEPGDVLVVSTGRDAREHALGEWDLWQDGSPGLDPSCLPWLHERGVAVLVSDVGQDVMPSGYDGMPTPIHAVGIVAMGLWLLDNASLGALTQACRERGTWEFLFLCAPLRLKGLTGSPVTPVAVL